MREGREGEESANKRVWLAFALFPCLNLKQNFNFKLDAKEFQTWFDAFKFNLIRCDIIVIGLQKLLTLVYLWLLLVLLLAQFAESVRTHRAFRDACLRRAFYFFYLRGPAQTEKVPLEHVKVSQQSEFFDSIYGLFVEANESEFRLIHSAGWKARNANLIWYQISLPP